MSSKANLRYVILPGTCAWNYPYVDTHDRAYDFWKELWTETLREVGAKDGPRPDEFSRMDKVALILDGNKIIAMLCHAFVDLRSKAAREQSYIARYFNDTFFAELGRHGAKRVASFEFLGVHPDERASSLGVSLATVIIDLGLRLIDEAGADAGIAAARCDVGVDKISRRLGAVTAPDEFLVHGVRTALLTFFPENVRAARERSINHLADRLWRDRIDLTVGERDTFRSVA